MLICERSSVVERGTLNALVRGSNPLVRVMEPVFDRDPDAKREVVWTGQDARGETEWSWERQKYRVVRVSYRDGRSVLHLECCSYVDALGQESWNETNHVPSSLFLRCLLGEDQGNTSA